MERLEIRIILLYEFDLGHSAAEAFRNIISAKGCTTTIFFPSSDFVHGKSDQKGSNNLKCTFWAECNSSSNNFSKYHYQKLRQE